MASMSDRAMAVFAFAAYHQLGTGQKVSRVVQRDGAGHRADGEAVRELEERGLATADGHDIAFTPDGERVLEGAVEALRRALDGA